MGFLTRFAAAFALLAATFNPTQYNYVRWLQTGWQDNMALITLSGLLLLVGYIIFLRAIGVLGMLLILAITGAALWVLIDFGWLTLDNPSQNIWIGLIAAALVLGIGLNWSLVRRSLSGQADMDDVDE